MALVKDGVIVQDPWTRVADEDALPDGPALVSLARWRTQAGNLRGHNHGLGIVLANDDAVEEIAGDLERFDLVCLEFPKFQDGRAYSQARRLRQRHGFSGELRATGHVLRDQLLFMTRCGFDAFEVTDPALVQMWQRALTEITVAYQHAADTRRTAIDLRTDDGRR